MKGDICERLHSRTIPEICPKKRAGRRRKQPGLDDGVPRYFIFWSTVTSWGEILDFKRRLKDLWWFLSISRSCHVLWPPLNAFRRFLGDLSSRSLMSPPSFVSSLLSVVFYVLSDLFYFLVIVQTFWSSSSPVSIFPVCQWYLQKMPGGNLDSCFWIAHTRNVSCKCNASVGFFSNWATQVTVKLKRWQIMQSNLL